MRKRNRRRDVSTRAQVTGLAFRLGKVEQEVAQNRLNHLGIADLARLLPVRGGPAGEHELLEQRLIGLCDLVFRNARSADPEEAGRWDRVFLEAKEALADCGLRVVVPEGRFDPATARAVEVEEARSEEEHLAIRRVHRPAVVREDGKGTQLVRPAAVVVADCRVRSGHRGSTNNQEVSNDTTSGD